MDGTGDAGVGFAKLNYGQEFIDVLDCSREIAHHVYGTVSKIREVDKKMKETRKRILLLYTNPEYAALKNSLSFSLQKLEGAAENVIKSFNERNGKKIELVKEGLEKDYFGRKYISVIRPLHPKGLEGTATTDFGPTASACLKTILNLKPSELFDSLLDLNHVGLTDFFLNYSPDGQSELTLEVKPPEEEKSMVYRPPQVLRISPENLKGREIEEMLDDGASANVKLFENVVYPDFRAEVNFKKGVQEVEISCHGSRGERKEWIKENVNKITGFNISKPEQEN